MNKPMSNMKKLRLDCSPDTTQTDVGRILKISFQAWAAKEAGKRKLRPNEITLVAAYYGISEADILAAHNADLKRQGR